MLQLPGNCRAGAFSVHPANWKSPRANIKEQWRVSYWFYDDNLKQRKKIVLKQGLNTTQSLAVRRDFVKDIIEDELHEIRDRGRNHITNTYSQVNENDISEFTPIVPALEWALQNIKVEHATRLGIALVLKNISKAIVDLHYDRMEIGQVKRKHLKFILEKCGKSNPKWSANLFNHYRKYLSMLYGALVDIDLVDANPVHEIAKQQHLNKIRDTLTKQQRADINRHLHDNYPTFWRFMQIFFHSGVRITELLNVKLSAVDLENQRYKVIVKKGRKLAEQYRIIKTIALPLWRQAMNNAGPEDYLFSKGLEPGAHKIRREQISRRWRMHVKEKMNVTADFYSLKHSNLDEISELLGINKAQEMAGHSTPVITMTYTVGEKERRNTTLKDVGNEF